MRPLIYRWAEIERIASGSGISLAIFTQLSVYLLFSIAFMGVPCPINSAGILFTAEPLKVTSIAISPFKYVNCAPYQFSYGGYSVSHTVAVCFCFYKGKREPHDTVICIVRFFKCYLIALEIII
jgi:hypothetical protein